MSDVDTSEARQQAQALREAAAQRLGIEAGYLRRKADLIDALAAERDALRARVDVLESARRAFDDAWATARAEGWKAGQEEMRREAVTVIDHITARWPHVGPVPSNVRGEWELRDRAVSMIRALPLTPAPQEPRA
jgi:flagellar biosynthesis/type III secretory pathway protein FliH